MVRRRRMNGTLAGRSGGRLFLGLNSFFGKFGACPAAAQHRAVDDAGFNMRAFRQFAEPDAAQPFIEFRRLEREGIDPYAHASDRLRLVRGRRHRRPIVAPSATLRPHAGQWNMYPVPGPLTDQATDTLSAIITPKGRCLRLVSCASETRPSRCRSVVPQFEM